MRTLCAQDDGIVDIRIGGNRTDNPFLISDNPKIATFHPEISHSAKQGKENGLNTACQDAYANIKSSFKKRFIANLRRNKASTYCTCILA